MQTSLNVSLSDRTREIILGSLLGDGSLKIHRPYKNARFSFRHSSTQREYFEWKVSQLADLQSASSVFLQKSDGFGTHPKIRFQSRALEGLSEIYHLTHRGGKLTIQRNWLNQLTPLSLAIWWMDDGSLISNARKGVLCTDGFDQKSQKILAKYLEVVWNIHVHIGKIGRKREGKQMEYFRLWMRSTEELKKFFRIILPHVQTTDMLPKVMILYNDPQLQQRWISEVSNLTGISCNAIERIAKEKKTKWKRYRE